MPDYGDAWYDRGLILQQAGRADLARASFQEALRHKLHPRIASFAHNNIGVIDFRQGRPWDAAREFQAALALVPQFPEARKNLAAALAAVGTRQRVPPKS
jgi:Flp pilus assembly protein TadD